MEDGLIPWLDIALRPDSVIWYDRGCLDSGDEFTRHIREAIAHSQIAILLVSTGFIHSDFVRKVELPLIEERAREGRLVVIPLLVEPCYWNQIPVIEQRLFLPPFPRALIDCMDSEQDWRHVRFQILDAIKTRMAGRRLAIPTVTNAAVRTISDPTADPHLRVGNISGENSAALIPSRVADIIYGARGSMWQQIIQSYKDELQADTVPPQVCLAMAASYNIARFRAVQHANHQIIHFDTSWAVHGPNFWNVNPEMRRWLAGQGSISHHRAQRRRRTTRVMFCPPATAKSNTSLLQMAQTIVTHLRSGIDLYVVSPAHWTELLDCSLYSKTSGIVSPRFDQFQFGDLSGASELEKGFDRFGEVCRLAKTGDALHFPLDLSLSEVVARLERFANTPSESHGQPPRRGPSTSA